MNPFAHQQILSQLVTEFNCDTNDNRNTKQPQGWNWDKPIFKYRQTALLFESSSYQPSIDECWRSLFYTLTNLVFHQNLRFTNKFHRIILINWWNQTKRNIHKWNIVAQYLTSWCNEKMYTDFKKTPTKRTWLIELVTVCVAKRCLVLFSLLF